MVHHFFRGHCHHEPTEGMSQVVILVVTCQIGEDVNERMVDVVFAGDAPPVIALVLAGSMLEYLSQLEHGLGVNQHERVGRAALLPTVLIGLRGGVGTDTRNHAWHTSSPRFSARYRASRLNRRS